MDKSLKLKLYGMKKTVMTTLLLLIFSVRRKINWLICQDIWNVFVTRCLSVNLTRQNKGINLIRSYLLPIFINGRDIEPVVIEKANKYNSFKFGDIQLLDIRNFLVGTASLESHLKAYRARETKRYIPYEQFHHLD